MCTFRFLDDETKPLNYHELVFSASYIFDLYISQLVLFIEKNNGNTSMQISAMQIKPLKQHNTKIEKCELLCGVEPGFLTFIITLRYLYIIVPHSHNTKKETNSFCVCTISFCLFIDMVEVLFVPRSLFLSQKFN